MEGVRQRKSTANSEICGMHTHTTDGRGAKEPEVFSKQKSLTHAFCQVIFIIENCNIALSLERFNYTQLMFRI